MFFILYFWKKLKKIRGEWQWVAKLALNHHNIDKYPNVIVKRPVSNITKIPQTGSKSHK
jgi:hypothetical protein